MAVRNAWRGVRTNAHLERYEVAQSMNLGFWANGSSSPVLGAAALNHSL